MSWRSGARPTTSTALAPFRRSRTTATAPPGTVLFLQYLNPAAYPPILHASSMLAEAGAHVVVLGVAQRTSSELLFEPSQPVTVQLVPEPAAGWRRKLLYGRWFLRAVALAVRLRPTAVYVSDPFATPAALILAWFGLRIIYHEHDALPDRPAGSFMRLVAWCRRKLASSAALCVVPGDARLRHFQVAVAPRSPVVSVMNCPRRLEVPRLRDFRGEGARCTLHYHGTLAPDRLPLAAVTALTLLPDSVELEIVGYEVPGGRGHLDRLRRAAADAGVARRVRIHGLVPSRKRMLELAAGSDVGLLLMSGPNDDPNIPTLAGASNKLYEYVAAGLPVLVTEGSGLCELARSLGIGEACDPEDPASIAGAFEALLARPDLIEARRAAYERTLDEWNYDAQFAPVVDVVLNRH